MCNLNQEEVIMGCKKIPKEDALRIYGVDVDKILQSNEGATGICFYSEHTDDPRLEFDDLTLDIEGMAVVDMELARMENCKSIFCSCGHCDENSVDYVFRPLPKKTSGRNGGNRIRRS